MILCEVSRISQSGSLSVRRTAARYGRFCPSSKDRSVDVPVQLRKVKSHTALRWGTGRLLGLTELESTVRYLGIEVDDALEIAEQTEV
jgi:hypothetical protein